MFMLQLPQIPIRHDQRKARVWSTVSLMWLRPSRTVHSLRRGTSYSAGPGGELLSGRHLVTRMVMLSAIALPPVDPLAGSPAGDRHRQVGDLRQAVRVAGDELVDQEALVVPGREVGALVGAPRLL